MVCCRGIYTVLNLNDYFLRVFLISKHLKLDSSILLLNSCVFFIMSLIRSSRGSVVGGSRGCFVDVLWVEPAGTWLESSQLSGSDLMSSRLVVAEVLVESFTELSMGLVWFKLMDSMLGLVMLLMYKLEWFTLVGSMIVGSRG